MTTSKKIVTINDIESVLVLLKDLLMTELNEDQIELLVNFLVDFVDKSLRKLDSSSRQIMIKTIIDSLKVNGLANLITKIDQHLQEILDNLS